MLGFLPPYVNREIDALSAAGVDVSVVLPEKSKGNRPADFWNEISPNPASRSVGVQRVLKFKYLTSPAWHLVFPLLKSLRFTKALFRSLREKEFRYFIVASDAVLGMNPSGRPDIIHAHFALDNAHIARIAAYILNVPYTVTAHATDIFVPRSVNRLRRVLSSAAAVFTISSYNINFLMNHGLSSKDIVVVRLGLNTSELPERKKPPEKNLAVCVASGLVPKKGVPVLMEAAAILQHRAAGCKLKVIGSDADGTRLKEYRSTDYEFPVEFPGALNSEETLDAVAAAAVFVLPCVQAENGDRDGIPVALMEAMGMGVPCISTRISGIPELIQSGVNGVLVNPDSAEELADAMERMFADRESASRMGLEGRKKITVSHSPEKQVHILFSNFNRILAEGK
ncbi:MAG: glycosyltransferase family 4 protein [Candidatus Fermentibacteraceae bacterium]|nr:glycosyltransferase family 4 protein [Candidatus Fermentibacteraceae bacterium]